MADGQVEAAYKAASAILDRCQHPGQSALSDGTMTCIDCWNAHVAARRAARRLELAAAPRCEVPSCSKRGVYKVGWDPEKVLLCGRHKAQADKRFYTEMAQFGVLASTARLSRTDILNLIVQG